MTSFKLLVFSAILGLGACSITSNNFLDQVKGKRAYISVPMADESNKFGTFSAYDGTIFTITFTGKNEEHTFISSSDNNTALYKDKNGNIKTFHIVSRQLTIEGLSHTFILE